MLADRHSLISIFILFLLVAGCDVHGLTPGSDTDDSADQSVDKNEVVVKTGEAALKMTKKAIRKVMQSPTAKMSVPPSKALKMLEKFEASEFEASEAEAKAVGDEYFYGTTSVSKANLTIEEDFSISVSTNSSLEGELMQFTKPSVGSQFGSSCSDCKSLAASTFRNAPPGGCTTFTANSSHQGPLGTDSSFGYEPCD